MKKRLLLLSVVMILLLCIPASVNADGDEGTQSLSPGQKIVYDPDQNVTQRFEFIPTENGMYSLSVLYANDFNDYNMGGVASFTHNGEHMSFMYTSHNDKEEYLKSYNNEFFGIKGESYILEFRYYISGDSTATKEYTVELTYSDTYKNKLSFDKTHAINMSNGPKRYSFEADTDGYYLITLDSDVEANVEVWQPDGTCKYDIPGIFLLTVSDGVKTVGENVFYLNAGDFCVTTFRPMEGGPKSTNAYLQKVPKITTAAGSYSGIKPVMKSKMVWFTPEKNGEYYFTEKVNYDYRFVSRASCIEIKRSGDIYTKNWGNFKECVGALHPVPGVDDTFAGELQYFFTGAKGTDYLFFVTYYDVSSSEKVTVAEDTPAYQDKRRNLKYSSLYNRQISDMEYTGKQLKPKIKLTMQGGMVESNAFNVKYSNNVKVGEGTATVTGKSPYYGSKTFTFKILPKMVPIKKLKAGKRSVTVTWKKQTAETTGYQIQYSMDPIFEKGVKTVTIKKNKTTKKTIKKLKSKKKYYFRIRTYKKVGKKTYYSFWSELKGDVKKPDNLNGLKPYCVKTK